MCLSHTTNKYRNGSVADFVVLVLVKVCYTVVTTREISLSQRITCFICHCYVFTTAAHVSARARKPQFCVPDEIRYVTREFFLVPKYCVYRIQCIPR